MTRYAPAALVAAFVLPVALTAQTPAPPATPDLNDAEVAHVAVTANAIDIDAARFALTRARDAEVKQFAQTMITDHGAVNQKATELAGRLHVTPADNAVSRSLQDGARTAHTALEGSRGAAFDKAYIAREVGYHQAVLDAIDSLLIPTTENADLRALLQQVRPAVAAHLEHAKMIQRRLQG